MEKITEKDFIKKLKIKRGGCLLSLDGLEIKNPLH